MTLRIFTTRARATCVEAIRQLRVAVMYVVWPHLVLTASAIPSSASREHQPDLRGTGLVAGSPLAAHPQYTHCLTYSPAVRACGPSLFSNTLRERSRLRMHFITPRSSFTLVLGPWALVLGPSGGTSQTAVASPAPTTNQVA